MQKSELLKPEEWHDIIRRRAESLRKPLIKKMPSTHEELGALLNALDFPEFEAAMASSNALQINLAIERARLEASWMEFSDEIRNQESALPRQDRTSTRVTGTAKKIAGYQSGPLSKSEHTPRLKPPEDGRPPGLYQGNGYYEDFTHDKEQLTAIHNNTENATEYLITCRLLDGLTRREVGEFCGKERQWMYGFEVDGQMPNAESLVALKTGFFTDRKSGQIHAERWERFETLLEANRYAQLRHAQKNCDYRQFGTFLRDTPDGIISKELRAYLSGDGSSNDTLIQTRGLYVTFLRRAAGFSNNQSAASALGLSEGTLVRCEHYYGDEARFPLDETYRENIAALERAVIAIELTENIPEEQCIGPFLEQAHLDQGPRWLKLPHSATRKTHIASLRRPTDGTQSLPS